MGTTIGEVFKATNSQILNEGLLPFTDTNYNLMAKKHGLKGNFEGVKSIINKAGLDISKFYFVDNEVCPYWYIDGFVHIQVFDLTEEFICFEKLTKHIKPTNEGLRETWENRDYSSFFFEIDNRFRLKVFLEHINEIPKASRYKVFKELYVNNDYSFSSFESSFIRDIFSLNNNRRFVKKLETDEKGYLTIYRGMGNKSSKLENAYSWTLNFNTAYFFATRLGINRCKIFKAKVHIDNVIDYITIREEDEILVLPENLVDCEDMKFLSFEEHILPMLEKNLLIDYYKLKVSELKKNWFENSEGIHGLLHAKRVLLHTIILSQMEGLDKKDRALLSYSSLWHDIGRTNDNIDDLHGVKSIEKMKKLKLGQGFSNEELAILRYIIKNHSIDDTTALINIQNESIQDKERAIKLLKLFKDANGLDRVRIDDLNIDYLRSESAKKLIIVAKEALAGIK